MENKKFSFSSVILIISGISFAIIALLFHVLSWNGIGVPVTIGGALLLSGLVLRVIGKK